MRQEKSRQPAELDAAILKQAVQETLCGIVITDTTLPDNPIVFANPAFERLTGYRSDEVIGRNPRFLQGADPDESITTMRGPLRQAMVKHHTCSVTLQNVRKDGTTYWVELTVTPLRNQAGVVTHYMGIQTDITALKCAQQELQAVFDKTVVGCIYAFMDSLALTCPTAYRIGQRLTKLVDRTAGHWPIEPHWKLRCAAMLSHVGCITVSEDILHKHERGEMLTTQEQNMMQGHPANGARLISHIPDLSDVADGIAHQYTPFGPSDDRIDPTLPSGGLPLLGRVLAILVEYDRLVSRPMPPNEAVARMAHQGARFDPELLNRFRKVVPDLDDPTGGIQWVKKRVDIKDIGPSTVVAQDVYDTHGVLLLSKGQELNIALRLRLQNYQKLGRVRGPIDVKVKTYMQSSVQTV